MATAAPNPAPGDDDNALQQLAVVSTGNPNIIARPDLAAALASGNASLSQASEANAFVGSLQAQKTLAQIRASGQKVTLPSALKSSLDAIGENYSDVEATQQDITNNITSQGLVPVSYDGQIVGARAKTSSEQSSSSGGWFSSPSDFWHHVTHNAVTNVISEGSNVVQAESSDVGSIKSNIGGGASLQNAYAPADIDANNQLMLAMGYDPTSEVSKLAFEAKGYARSNISSVTAQYGADKVAQAEQYLADPKKFTDDLKASASDEQDAISKLAILQDPTFNTVLHEVNSHSASLGTDVATEIGLDPIKNPDLYGYTSAGINFAAQMLTDPTVILGKAASIVKMAQVGINGFGDTDRFAQILDEANTSVLNTGAKAVQRGFHSAVDAGNMISDGEEGMAAAKASGSLEDYAAAQAKQAAGYDALRKVGLQELAPALTGNERVVGFAKNGTLLTGQGERLDTYDKLFDYVVNTRGMMALRSGKAGVESTLMPGSLSLFGATRVRAALAAGTDAKRVSWNLNKLETAAKLIPKTTSAMEVVSGKVLADGDEAETEAAGLASQMRASTSAFPTPAQLGTAEYNLKRYGNWAGTGVGGALGKLEVTIPKTGITFTPGSWLNPTAVAARAQIARQRLNILNVLPRNNEINLLDEQAPQKIFAFARTYLPIEQASILSSSFAAGDAATKRAVFQGMKAQVFHAAGLGYSESGRDIMEKWLSDDAQVYTHSADGVMEYDPWTQERDVDTALWNDQNRTTYSIPTFRQLHSAAAKTGLYESTLGRFLVSNVADAIGSKLRFGMLATPRTAVRASVEGWVNLLARGDARRALAAKAILADNGMLPKRIALLDKATNWAVPHLVGSWIRTVEKTGMTDDEAMFLDRIATRYPDLAEMVHASFGDHLLTGDVNPLSASKDALEVAQAGLKPARLDIHSNYERSGWEPRSTEGFVGAQRLDAALNLRRGGNPQTFQAIVDHIAEPTADGESFRKILDGLTSPDEYEGFRQSRWSRVYRDDNGVPQRAISDPERQMALEQHASRLLNDTRTMISGENGQINQDFLDKLRRKPVLSDDEMSALQEEHATKSAIWDGLTDDERTSGSGKHFGTQIDNLQAQIAAGGPRSFPDADWINEKLLGPDRPQSAIAPSFAPKVVEDEDAGSLKSAYQSVSAALQDLSGKSYDLMVTKPAQRMTSSPAFWANYTRARVETMNVEQQLIEEGYTEEAADHLMMMGGIRQAWVRTEATIDDPGLKTQFDVVGRNLVGFPRAINAFLRRYGQLVKNDPTVLRKAALAIQGAEHAGLVYTDPYGELTYTVPGSGFLASGLNDLATDLHFPGLIRLPIAGDITGKLLLSAPGFDNPIRPSLSPMLNIPFRFIANAYPDHREMLAEIDNVLNGSQGANRGVADTLTPALLRNWFDALDPAEQNTMLASSTISAYSSLRAYDPTGDKGIFPQAGDDPTGEKMTQVLGHIKTQVRNNLMLRATEGFFLPGAPSSPSEAGPDSKPDYSYMIRGARSLTDEYKMILNDFDGDSSMARVAFIDAHGPNALVYTQPTTTVTAAHADIPATRQSEQWMESNIGIIQKYPLVAAYFAPQATGNFDANAWAAQLDTGLRQKESVNDFVNSYELNVAQTTYFTAYDQMKTLQAAATAKGDTKQASYLATDFTQQMQPFLAAHPLMQQYLTLGTAQAAENSRQGIAQLTEMLNEPSANSLPNNVDPARKMLAAWNDHEAYQNNKTTYTSADRTLETKNFGTYMQSVLTANPQAAGLYDMFRALDTSAMPSAYTILQQPQAGGVQ